MQLWVTILSCYFLLESIDARSSRSVYSLAISFTFPSPIFSHACCCVYCLPSRSARAFLVSAFIYSQYSPSVMLSPRFHLAATRGHLDCLNLILGHSVDVTATDASGEFWLDEGSTRELYLEPWMCFQCYVLPIISGVDLIFTYCLIAL